MKTPPLLLGMTLLLWGWQTDHLILGIIVALLLEGSRLITMRWDLAYSDFNRISDLCTVIFVGMFIYFYASSTSPKAIMAMFQWMPVALLPLMLAQVYGTSDKIDISALFLLFRRKKGEKGAKDPTTLNLTYPYFVLCFLSASTANMKTPWFYVGVFGLSGWALWSIRSKRFSPVLWTLLLLLVGSAGYVGHHGLRNLQALLEKKTVSWFTDLFQRDRDPYQANTAIGDVGQLKLSDRIVLRVHWKSGKGRPLLLREASYNAYRASTWFALHPGFKKVRLARDRKTWQFDTPGGSEKEISVSQALKRGKGMLKLPMGTCEVAHLPVMRVFKNQFGAVKVEEGPGLVQYRLRFNPARSWDGAPDETDLKVPDKEMHTLGRMVEKLGLRNMPPQKALKVIDEFFQKNFTYSLALAGGGGRQTALENFLVNTRSGHCEYFASATVLLLRAAGIPARYATGYVMREFSPMEDCFLVRARHAHAWVLVHVNGVWQDFDTTPPSWFTVEQAASSTLEPLYDIWSWILFQYSQWRWGEREGGWARYLGWLLIPLILLLVRRLYTRRRVKQIRKEKGEMPGAETRSGTDSALYLIERKLLLQGYERKPWESLFKWFKRIEEETSGDFSSESLEAILVLHYRYRFDPNGITRDERDRLGILVQHWLAENNQSGPHA